MRGVRWFAILFALGVLPSVSPVEARTLKVRFPRFEVAPHTDREVCTFIRLPAKRPFDMAGLAVANVGGGESFTSHHFIAYAYTGADVAGFPPDGEVVENKGCLDFGPADRNSRVLLTVVQTTKRLDRFPLGLAQRLTPVGGGAGQPQVIGIMLNSHWINGSDRPRRASAKLRLMGAKPGTVRRTLKAILEYVANGFLFVRPGERTLVGWTWGPGLPDLGLGALGGAEWPSNQPTCLAAVSSHMHKRGKSFTVDLVRTTGERQRLVETLVYSDPQHAIFDGQHGNPPPLLLMPGDKLEYHCLHDNGVTTPTKLGCEEVPGETPGKSVLGNGLRYDGAAKRCSRVGAAPGECPATDPAFPARTFTGNCVPANLVFGFTSDDDMCIMPGAYFDANPDAPPGRECDLSLASPLP